MALKFTTSYLEDSISLLRCYKKIGAAAVDQGSDDQLTTVLYPEMNSIALIVKHMAGNMRSRWTDLLTSDGEKPDRNRDGEFVDPPLAELPLSNYGRRDGIASSPPWSHSRKMIFPVRYTFAEKLVP
jgi:hypothetical protein